MATTTGATAVAIDPPDGTQPLSPTITHYQQLATDFMRALDEIAVIIPQLEEAHFTTASFVRTHQNVPDQFLATAVSAVEQTVELQGVRKLDVLAARDTLQFMEAFRPVLDKVVAFGKNLEFTLKSRKATLVLDALQIYYIAKGLARDPNSAAVGSLAANMKRDLGKSSRPRLPQSVRNAIASAQAAVAAAGAEWPDGLPRSKST